MSKLIIIGAGGHGKVVADAANRECLFVDKDPNEQAGVHAMESLPLLQQEGDEVIVGIGDNKMRLNVLDGLHRVATVVHKDATVSESATLGEGTVVFARAVVNPNATVGRGCIINTSATVDHDCVLEGGVHISPGAHVGGGVSIGECSWVGIGASVKHGVKIGNHVTVGASAAVVNDIPDGLTVVGVPAKEIST
jgi:sugar O-acyltransferase (sialic acid O-acetyltransferase NeuD family)